MGNNREFNSNEQTNEIQQTITEEFGVSKKDLYTIWLGYMSRFSKGIDRVNAIQMIKLDPTQYNNKAINAFIAIGLECLTFEMVDNSKQMSFDVEG